MIDRPRAAAGANERARRHARSSRAASRAPSSLPPPPIDDNRLDVFGKSLDSVAAATSDSANNCRPICRHVIRGSIISSRTHRSLCDRYAASAAEPPRTVSGRSLHAEICFKTRSPSLKDHYDLQDFEINQNAAYIESAPNLVEHDAADERVIGTFPSFNDGLIAKSSSLAADAASGSRPATGKPRAAGVVNKRGQFRKGRSMAKPACWDAIRQGWRRAHGAVKARLRGMRQLFTARSARGHPKRSGRDPESIFEFSS